MVIADLLVGLVGVWTGVMLKTDQDRDVYKLAGLIPLFGTMNVSIFSLVFLTFDRLLAIKYPFRYDSLMTHSRVVKLIAVSWIIPVIATIIQSIIYVMTDGNFELKVRNATLTAIFLTGFVVLSVSNIMLLLQVRQQRRRFATMKVTPLKLEFSRKDQTHSVGEEARFRVASDPGTRGCVTTTNQPCVTSPLKTDLNKRFAFDNGAYDRAMSCKGSKTFNNPFAFDNRAFEQVTPNTCSKTLSNVASLDISEANDTTNSGGKRRYTVSLPFNKAYEFRKVNGEADTKSKDDIRPLELDLNSNNSTEDMSDDKFPRNDSTSSILTNSSEDEESKTQKSELSNQSNVPITVRPMNNKKVLPALAKSYLKLKSKSQNIKDRKISVMCIWIVLLFLLCWLPLICYRFSFVVGRTQTVPWFRRLSQCFALSNSLLNPFLYFLMRTDFRQMLKQLMGFKTNKKFR